MQHELEPTGCPLDIIRQNEVGNYVWSNDMQPLTEMCYIGSDDRFRVFGAGYSQIEIWLKSITPYFYQLVV